MTKTTKKYILKPCPFCGAAPSLVDQNNRDGKRVYPTYSYPDMSEWDVKCSTVGCYLEGGAGFWITRDEVVEMWNKRAGDSGS